MSQGQCYNCAGRNCRHWFTPMINPICWDNSTGQAAPLDRFILSSDVARPAELLQYFVTINRVKIICQLPWGDICSFYSKVIAWNAHSPTGIFHSSEWVWKQDILVHKDYPTRESENKITLHSSSCSTILKQNCSHDPTGL